MSNARNLADGESRFVNTAGDTMTGDLIVDANVGVGTSSPSTYGGLVVQAASGVGSPLTLLTTDAGANAQVVFKGSRQYQIGTGNASSGFADSLFIYDGTAGLRMLIDSAGRVTMPYQPAFAVYKTGSQATNTPAAQLTGWAESFNTGGHFSTATSRFTAPISGKYLINYTGLHNSGGVGTGYWVRVYLMVNGAIVVDGLGDNGTYGTYQRLSLSQVLSLNTGDYVTLLAESSIASSIGVYAGYTNWSGYLIG